jgi:rare lipoprotein A
MHLRRLAFPIFPAFVASWCFAPSTSARAPGGASDAAAPASSAAAPKPLDRSGQRRHGKASWYGRGFAGKTMADGTPMDPSSNNAASKTLPLGTTAKVTNLDNGKSAVVEIRDRGPYVPGRIVDVSPQTATQLGLVDKGVAPVVVAPIEVPQPDGSVKPGAAAPDE